MSRTNSRLVAVVRSLTLLALCALFLSLAGVASATTTISGGTLTGSATWTKEESPYVITGTLIIPAGRTLTINPGAIVKIAPDIAPFTVEGTLMMGSADGEQVTITSLKDDTVGGDTNEDSTATTPHPGDWQTITINQGGHALITNTTIRYGGASLYAPWMGGYLPRPSLENNGGALSLTNVLLSESGNNGIEQISGSTTITNSSFSIITQKGILSQGGDLSVSSSTWNGMQEGIVVTGGRLTIEGNIFHNLSTGNALSLEGTLTSFTNNGGNKGDGVISLGLLLPSTFILSPDGLPYSPRYLDVGVGQTLTIRPGAVIAMKPTSLFRISGGTLIVGGDPEEDKVIITSSFDALAWGGTEVTPPHPGDWGSIQIDPNSTVTITNTLIRYGGREEYDGSLGGLRYDAALQNDGGRLTIDTTTLSDNQSYGIRQTSGTTTITSAIITRSRWGIESSGGAFIISSSTVQGNTDSGITNKGDTTIYATHNWWGHSTGPQALFNQGGQGDSVSLGVDYFPWLSRDPTLPPDVCAGVVDCYSNVLFLPGIEASRLFWDDPDCFIINCENQLWEPNRSADVEKLYLDDNGKSLRPDIYTNAVIDEVNLTNYTPHPDKNIYKSFLADLKRWKETERIIGDYSVVPYDWRLSLDDILDNGSKETNGNIYYAGERGQTEDPYLIQELKRLAASSRTGKVTIIAHSNGGLVTKALTNKLGSEASDLIDKIVFVSVPQAGTPQALGALLHGHEQGLPFDWLPFFLSPETARQFASTSPMAYNLLPSASYFTYVDNNVVTFDNSQFLAPWRERYGAKIHSEEMMRRFILDEARPDLPVENRVDMPLSGKGNLLAQATALHNDVLDSWVPPPGVELTEIGGWGEETMAGITYSEGSDTVCSDPRAQVGCASYPVLSIKPDEVIDGDGTVVTASTLWTPLSTGVKKYWVNLREYNGFFSINRKHADILEVPELRILINNVLRNSASIDESNQDYISTVAPQAQADDTRLRFLLHSPLDLHLYDNLGNHTGISTTTGRIEENIPGSRYKTYGELKLVEAPASTTLTLVMNGYATGSFTLDIDKMNGNNIIASTTFAGIPSATSTIATITVPEGGDIDHASPLAVDRDGDGEIDMALSPILGNIVFPDFTAPHTNVSLSGILGTNDWYTSNVTVTISATDTSSGVNNTFYSFNNGATWQTYVAPLTVLSEGSTTLLYYSTDNAGNREATSILTIKIDKTAPKVRLFIDSTTKDLTIEGSDNAGTATTVKNGDSYTVTDIAGHTTKLFFQKTFTGNRLTYAKLIKIQYDNGVITALPSSYFVYLWQAVTPQTLVSQLIAVNDTYVIDALYDKVKNKTTVLLKKKGVVVQTQQFTGLRIIKFIVDNGVVGYEI